MKSLKSRIVGAGLLLCVGLIVPAWSQSKTTTPGGAPTTQVAGKEVTLTLVRWPFT